MDRRLANFYIPHPLCLQWYTDVYLQSFVSEMLAVNHPIPSSSSDKALNNNIECNEVTMINKTIKVTKKIFQDYWK